MRAHTYAHAHARTDGREIADTSSARKAGLEEEVESPEVRAC